jgi:aspartate/methionine/tyrosine aminotransferase
VLGYVYSYLYFRVVVHHKYTTTTPQTGEVNAETSQFKNMVYMPCNPDNGWFPDLAKLPHADVIHFCSPNNPTGACATR